MKYFGNIENDFDLTTKKYVDDKCINNFNEVNLKAGVGCEIIDYENTKRLPEEYEELEFIKGNKTANTSAIDTELVGTENTKIELAVKQKVQNGSTYPCIIGNGKTAKNLLYCLQLTNGDYRIIFGSGAYTLEGGTVFDKTIIKIGKDYRAIENAENKTIVEDTTAFPDTLTTNGTITIGWVKDIALTGSVAYRGYIYYCKIWEGEELVSDLVPAKRKSDNQVGLYDLVRNKFIFSSLVDSWLAGPNATNKILNVKVDNQTIKVNSNNQLYINTDSLKTLL